MKKLFIPIISMLALTSLAGCSNGGDSSSSSTIPESSEPASSSEESSSEAPVDYSDLKIIAPSGAPALALYDKLDNKNVTIDKDPNNVAAFLSNDSKMDIVIAPTNLVVSKVIKDGAPFKLAGVITFGNFFIASTGNDDNDTLDKDDHIVVFQRNGLPGKIFDYTYGTDFEHIHSANAASDAVSSLVTGKDNLTKEDVDYVLLAQPGLTAALAKAKEHRSRQDQSG